MSTSLPRRAFLQALAAAPAVAQKLAEEAVGVSVEAVGGSALMDGVPGVPAVPGGPAKMLELAGLAKAGLLTDWVKRWSVRNSRYDRRLEPDVACLRSVSLGAKIAISAERRLAREWETLERDALDRQLMAQFMGWPQG